jgi:hypothetical protein
MSKTKVTFSNNLGKLPQRAKREIQKAVVKSANIIRNNAVERVQKGPASGRTYKRGKGRTHVASAPGESPATDFGFLASNIAVQLEGDKMAADIGVFGAIITDKKGERPRNYAIDLEFGTSRVQPRPFLQPASEESRIFVLKAMTQAVRDAIVIATRGK